MLQDAAPDMTITEALGVLRAVESRLDSERILRDAAAPFRGDVAKLTRHVALHPRISALARRGEPRATASAIVEMVGADPADALKVAKNLVNLLA
jgi:hypothetical protein